MIELSEEFGVIFSCSPGFALLSPRQHFTMIHEFEIWTANRTDSNRFSDLSDTVLAIEASFYLDRLLTTPPAKEPLLSALGGLPFALQAHIEQEINSLRSHNIRPLFVFNGLNVGKKHNVFQQSESVTAANEKAWDLYNQHNAEQAVDTFGGSGASALE